MSQHKWKHPVQPVVLSQFILNVTFFPSRMVTSKVTFNFLRVQWDPSLLSDLPARLQPLIHRTARQISTFNTLKLQRVVRQISASPFRRSHSEARHMLPHWGCVAAGGSPLPWGAEMGCKCLIHMPSSSRPIIWNHFSHRTPQQRTENWRFSVLMPAWYARPQIPICLNHNSVCTRRKILGLQLRRVGHPTATPPPPLAFRPHCYPCCLTYMIRSSDSYRINLFFSRTSLSHSCKSCASSCVPESV